MEVGRKKKKSYAVVLHLGWRRHVTYIMEQILNILLPYILGEKSIMKYVEKVLPLLSTVANVNNRQTSVKSNQLNCNIKVWKARSLRQSNRFLSQKIK